MITELRLRTRTKRELVDITPMVDPLLGLEHGVPDRGHLPGGVGRHLRGADDDSGRTEAGRELEDLGRIARHHDLVEET